MEAKKRWEHEDGRGWPVPQAPSKDPRLQHAQRLLYAVPEERRDAALEALQKLTQGA
jgi:hypothetical protein